MTASLGALGVAVGSGPANAVASHAIRSTSDGTASRWADRPNVTLQLRPQGTHARARLDALSGAPVRSARTAADRAAELDNLTPSPAAVAAVERYARSRGLHVLSASRWTVSVGGPLKRLTRVFATSTHRVRSHLDPAAGRAFIAPAAPLRVPEALRETVSRAVGLDTRPLYRHASIPAGGYTGADIRDAYGATSSGSGAGLTVATIQYAPLNTGDVQTYASAAGITISTGQITAVGVAGATAIGDDHDGTGEAVLDTESLLAVAPGAKQRVYVAPNSLSAYVAVEGQIASDAQDGLVQAVSSSWGSCEAGVSRSEEASEDVEFALMVAAGATVFQASGDSGAYGCSTPDTPDGTVSVGYPDASPYVVTVGGTRLTRNSTGWTETTWQNPQAGGDPDTTYQGDASGGGTSIYEARPSWQSKLTIAGSKRLVPDIAAVADPSTGMRLYVSDDGGWRYEGGTSLSAPLEAALFVDALSAAGRTTGLGDIHAALYAAPASDYRDVTTGSNYVYNATTGYDEATGLGAPLWNKLGAYLTGTTATPTPTPTPTRTSPSPTPTISFTPIPTPSSTTGPPQLANGPDLIGAAKVGRRLTCAVSYQNARWTGVIWRRDGQAISGQTAMTYVLRPADYGHDVSCQTEAYNDAGWSAVSTSPSLTVALGKALRATSRPWIFGVRKAGHTLTVHPGHWAPHATHYSYVWKRGRNILLGATGRRLHLRKADAHHTVRVTVTAHRQGYRPGVRTVKRKVR